VFSWDEAKNKRNQRKHGVSFEAAKLVFARRATKLERKVYEQGT
jgi:uncharacterized DUF497 family protein